MYKFSTPFVEGFKELARVVILTALSTVVTWVLHNVNLLPHPEFSAIYVMALTALGKMVDEWMGQAGEKSNSPMLEGGITRF